MERRNPIAAGVLLFCCRHRIPLLSRMVRILLGCDIYCAIPPGLILAHPYGIVIHSAAKLGRDVTILQHVTIGAEFNCCEAPTVGDRVMIGAGAVIIGAVTVGDDVIIGANAVVTRDVPPNMVVVGANRLIAKSCSSAVQSDDFGVVRG